MPELPEDPLNREPDLQHLASSFLTPIGDAYDRNHCIHPHLDGSTHHIRIDGAVDKPLELSMKDLKNDFEQHDVVCALQCAGNRRHTMYANIGRLPRQLLTLSPLKAYEDQGGSRYRLV